VVVCTTQGSFTGRFRLRQPDPSAATVLGNEGYASFLEGKPDQLLIAVAHLATFFEGANGHCADGNPLSKVLLGPVKQRSSSPALFCSKHTYLFRNFDIEITSCMGYLKDKLPT
jgi:hypothetical protein